MLLESGSWDVAALVPPDPRRRDSHRLVVKRRLTWNALGTVALPRMLRVGLALSSGDPTLLGLSTLTHVVLTSPDLPLPSPQANN